MIIITMLTMIFLCLLSLQHPATDGSQSTFQKGAAVDIPPAQAGLSLMPRS